MKTVTITVTQDDIDQGRVADCNKCPVALACIRAFATPHIHVLSNVTVGAKGGLIDYYWMPYEAYNFIHDFDNLKKVRPITFEIRKL